VLYSTNTPKKELKMIKFKQKIKIIGWSATGLLTWMFISSPNVFYYLINM
jgi:hypothetical protein